SQLREDLPDPRLAEVAPPVGAVIAAGHEVVGAAADGAADPSLARGGAEAPRAHLQRPGDRRAVGCADGRTVAAAASARRAAAYLVTTAIHAARDRAPSATGHDVDRAGERVPTERPARRPDHLDPLHR